MTTEESLQDGVSDLASTSIPGNSEKVASNISVLGQSLEAANEKPNTDNFAQAQSLGADPSRPKTASLARPSNHFFSRSCTLPANTGSKVECKVLDVENLPKLSKWDVFKNKIYLGSAYGGSRRMTTMPETKSFEENEPEKTTQEHEYCEVTTIEGLDLEGLPPMTHKSRKLFSWSKIKIGVRGKKAKDTLDTCNEDEGESSDKMQKRFRLGWLQKFWSARVSNTETGFGNGENSKEIGQEETKNVPVDTYNPILEEVL